MLNHLDQQYKVVEEDCKLYRQALDQLTEETVDEDENRRLQEELDKVLFNSSVSMYVKYSVS